MMIETQFLRNEYKWGQQVQTYNLYDKISDCGRQGTEYLDRVTHRRVHELAWNYKPRRKLYVGIAKRRWFDQTNEASRDSPMT